MSPTPWHLLHQRSAIAAIALILVSCSASEAPPPWDTDQMVRQLTAELRQFEREASDFEELEVLAWRIDARGKERVEIALLWGRGHSLGKPRWALVQGYRHPGSDERWRRSLFNRELVVPLTQPRPGENTDGTWRAYERYDHAPTSREICEFASVSFLEDDQVGGFRRVSGTFRNRAWRRVAGEQPRCGFDQKDGV